MKKISKREKKYLGIFGVFVLTIAAYFIIDGLLNKGPDLIVSDIYLEDGELTIIQKNNGRTDVAMATNGRTDVYVDDMENIAFSSLWSGLESLEFLDAGSESKIVPNNFLEGTHNIKVCIDASFLVDESREENNCLEKRIGNPKVSIELNKQNKGNLILNGKGQELISFSITAHDDLSISHLPLALTVSNDNHDPNAGLLDENGNSNFVNIRLVDLSNGNILYQAFDSSDLKIELNGEILIDEDSDSSSAAFYLFIDPIEMKTDQRLDLALLFDQNENPALENTAIAANLHLGLEYPRITGNKIANNKEYLLPHEPIFGDIKAIESK